MKKWLFVLLPTIAITAMITWLAVHALADEAADDSATETVIASAALGEQRRYSVHLPASYRHSPDRRYPVVYVLDGPSQASHTAASAALMAQIEVTPELIVVGIANLDDETRQRDLTPPGMRQDSDEDDGAEGRADKFLEFIAEEMIPQIDKDYRTSSSRTIAGHSRGGLFVVYALTAKPSLFQAYLANSPAMWRDGDAMIARLDRHLKSDRPATASLFLSLGSDENPKMKGAFLRTVAALKKDAPATLRWHSLLTPGAGHSDNAGLATPAGLRWSFDSRWLPESRIAPASP